MALNNRNVEKAKQILADMMGWKGTFFNEWNKEDPYATNTILVAGRVGDGWENVFLNVQDITQEQLNHFNSRKNEVANSSFIEPVTKDGITCLGWF